MYRAIVVTQVVRVPVSLQSPVIWKFFMSTYLDNHLSESLRTWIIGGLTFIPWHCVPGSMLGVEGLKINI